MTATLISKLAAASIKVGALATDKRNTQQGYNYISADKILDRAGNALAGVGRQNCSVQARSPAP